MWLEKIQWSRRARVPYHGAGRKRSARRTDLAIWNTQQDDARTLAVCTAPERPADMYAGCLQCARECAADAASPHDVAPSIREEVAGRRFHGVVQSHVTGLGSVSLTEEKCSAPERKHGRDNGGSAICISSQTQSVP